MPDLLEFLSDGFQYRLKEAAAAASHNRFENALQQYFEDFFAAFSQLGSAHEADTFSTLTSDTRPQVYEWIDCAQRGLQAHVEEYRQLFRDLAYVYQVFIRGRRYYATLHLFDLLEKYDMADVMPPDELGLFYKGRAKRLGDAVTEEEYYYHIGFDKRSLVSNQRFSYSGQPILYLGSSMLDVLYELRCGLADYQSLALAAFGHDPLAASSTRRKTNTRLTALKIYDVTNHIHKTITQTLFDLVQSEVGIPACDDPGYRPNLKDLKKEFKKFILTQICTFKRQHGQTFIEEYVPAQLLTEALRINSYHGVKFPSTQFDGKDLLSPGRYSLAALQENLALFTTYSGDEPYDHEMLSHFFVQPLDEATALSHSVAECKQNIQQLRRDISLLSLERTNKIINMFTNASMSVEQVIACQDELTVEGKPYWDWDFARLELYAQATYLSKLKDQVSYFTDGQQTMFPIK